MDGSFSNSGTFKANNSTVTITGSFLMDAGLFNGGLSTLNFNGSVTLTSGTFVPGTNVNYGAAADQTIISGTYANLTTSGGAGIKTTGGSVTVTSILTVGSGTTFAVGATPITVLDATIINGTLLHSSAAGTPKTYTDVTINGGGAWTETAAVVISFGGNLQNDGTLTASTGAHTFTGSGKTFSGTSPIAIPNTTISGSYTNNGTLTVSTALSGAGSLTQGTPNPTLNIGGISNIVTLAASASPNTVNYNGAAQAIAGITYNNLIVSGSALKTINGNVTVNGNLAVNSGTALTVGTSIISVTGTTTVGGTLTHNSTTGAKTYNGNVTISGGGTWTESAAVLISFGGNLQNDGTLNAGTGVHTFTGAGKTFSGTNPISIPNITISGSYTNNGTLTVGTALAGGGSLTQGSGATLNLGGTLGIGTLTATASPNTVNYSGTAQSIAGITYNNLFASGSGIKTINGNVTVNGNLAVNSGTTLTVDTSTISVAGTTTVGGTLTHTSTTGAKTYSGNVTINSGGTWTESVVVLISFGGNLQNDGTLTVNTGIHTFTGAGKTFSGTNPISIPNITISGSYTNNGTLTAGTALAGGGSLTQGSGAVLNISQNSSIGTLTAGSNINTVNYSGAAQNVIATSYYHLTLSGSGVKTLPVGLTTVNGNLTLSGTVSAISADNLTIGGALTVGPGTAFTVGAFSITVMGATTISGSGILTNSSAIGARIYTGDVTIGSGSTWFDNADVITISFGGDFQNNGTLNAGDGVHTFTGAGKTFGGVVSIPNITISGSYTNNGTLTVSNALGGGGSLTQGTNATLNIGGFSSIGTLTASANPNTVKYNRSGIQTVRSITYHHLTLSGNAVTKTLGGAVAVNGNLTIETGATLDVSASDFAMDVAGNWSNNGTFNPRAGTVTLPGSTAQTISGAATTFNNLIINNNAGVVLTANISVNNALTLTNGKINTGSKAVIIDTAASLIGADSTRYINGNLQRNFTTGPQSYLYQIGDATNYTPLTLVFANITTPGNVAVKSTSGEATNIGYSGLDLTHHVKRYWTFTSTSVPVFTTYDATFTFVDGDIDAGADPSIFIVNRNVNYPSTNWVPTTIGTWTINSTQVTGVTVIGNSTAFAIGQPDVTPPVVTNVTANKANGSYNAGVLIPIQVTFNELVAVTGTPRLTLRTGLIDRVVNYTGGNGTAMLTFNYTVGAGDTSSDLDYLSSGALDLNGGSIRDYASKDAILILPDPGQPNSLGANKDIVIDTTAPTVSNVTSPNADGTYNSGDITVTVTFSEAVNVTGVPTLTLETGITDRTANYSGGTGTDTLSFTYTIQPNDLSPDLDYIVTSPLKLNGGTIRDAALNNASLTLATPGAVGSLGYNKNIVIDTNAAAVTNVTSPTADGFYKSGDIIITMTFNEAVNVTGTPTLTLETGTTDRTANYSGGTGTDTLSFTYTIQAGDTSSDLNYVAADSLSLNSGTIRDSGGNNAALTLPAPTGAGSLATNKAIVIDTTAPDTTITGQPIALDKNNTPTFTFSGNDGTGSGVASFMCKLDGGAYSACTSPFLSSALPDGAHTFSVYAIDAAGNADATPASYSWTVDATAPNTTITGHPANPDGNRTPTFTFSGDDGTGSGIASFMCKMDGGSYAACTSGYTSPTLSEGSHTFYVYAIDTAGNADLSPASYTWTIQTVQRIFLPLIVRP